LNSKGTLDKKVVKLSRSKRILFIITLSGVAFIRGMGYFGQKIVTLSRANCNFLHRCRWQIIRDRVTTILRLKIKNY